MAIEIRKPIAVSSAGLFLGAVFCGVTLCTGTFLERKAGVESVQSKTILLIGLVLAAPLLVIFSRWRDRIGRKWIAAGGVVLGVLAGVFLTRQVPVIAGTAGRTELTDQKEIRSTVAFIGKSRDLTRTTSTFTHFADGMQVVETKEDTVFADGRIGANPRITVSRTLNTGDYWKIVAILFVMALSMAMVCGPIAARLAGEVASARAPTVIGNGIAAGLIPFIAVLLTANGLTANPPGDKLTGLWYPAGVLIICFVTGALAIPSKGRTFAHVD